MINIAITIHGIVKHKLYDHDFIKYWTKLFPIQSYISYIGILLYKKGYHILRFTNSLIGNYDKYCSFFTEFKVIVYFTYNL